MTGALQSSRGAALPALLKPDYHKSDADVFHDAMRLAMRETGDLWLFQYIDHGDSLPEAEKTPLWVPAIFKKLDPKREPNYMRSDFNASQRMSISKIYDDRDDDMTDSRLLTVHGVAVDPVESVGPVFGPKLFQDIKGTLDIVRRVLSRRLLTDEDDKDDHNGQHTVLAPLAFGDLGMVLVAGSTFDHRPVNDPEEDAGTFIQFMEALEMTLNDANLQ